MLLHPRSFLRERGEGADVKETSQCRREQGFGVVLLRPGEYLPGVKSVSPHNAAASRVRV